MAARRSDVGLIGGLAVGVLILFAASLAVGPVLLSPATVIAGHIPAISRDRLSLRMAWHVRP